MRDKLLHIPSFTSSIDDLRQSVEGIPPVLLCSTSIIVLIFLSYIFKRLIHREKGSTINDGCKRNKDGDIDELRFATKFFDYLDHTYWNGNPSLLPGKRVVSAADLKPVLRISNSRRQIHIVYSKKTLWNLAFSRKLQSGLNEKFAFIFKGLKSWSIQETQGRFSEVMQNLLEFRQEIQQVLHENLDMAVEEISSKLKGIKIKEPTSILDGWDLYDDKNVICEEEELALLDENDPCHWKLSPPAGLELKVPSVCFVIPAPDADGADLAASIEIQYKHLLSLWKEPHRKESAEYSQISSKLRILKCLAKEKVEEAFIIPSVEAEVDQLSMQVENIGLSNNESPTLEKRNIQVEEPLIVPSVEARVEQLLMQVESNVITTNNESPTFENHGNGQTPQTLLRDVDEFLQDLEKIQQKLSSKGRFTIDKASISEEIKEANEVQNDLDVCLPIYKSIIMEIEEMPTEREKLKTKQAIEKCNLVVYKLKEWMDRLRLAISIANDANICSICLSNAQDILMAQHGISSDLQDIDAQCQELLYLKEELAKFSDSIKKLQIVLFDLRGDELREAKMIIKNWRHLFVQCQARFARLTQVKFDVSTLQEQLQIELQWLENAYSKLKLIQCLPDNQEMKHLFRELLEINEALPNHREPIQEVFYKAEEFILSSQAYERDLKDFIKNITGNSEEKGKYEVAIRSREWVSKTILKLSQFYEVVLKEIPLKIDVLTIMLNCNSSDKDVEAGSKANL